MKRQQAIQDLPEKTHDAGGNVIIVTSTRWLNNIFAGGYFQQ